NYTASIDARFESIAAGSYAALGIRDSGGPSSHTLSGTPYALRLGVDGSWSLLRRGSTVASGELADFDASAWHNLSVTGSGASITAAVDGTQVATWTDPEPQLSGFVTLASSFSHTQFDNLSVVRVANQPAFYGSYLDNLEMTSLEEAPTPVLMYDGAWDHANGKGMFVYQRSESTTASAGASLSHAFDGTGLDIIGVNNGSARVRIDVDGRTIVSNAQVEAKEAFGQALSLRGLSEGRHEVTITLLAGELTVDAVGTVSDRPRTAPGTAALEDAVRDAAAIERDEDFTDATWDVLQANLEAARAALEDPEGYGLSVEGAAALVSRLEAASAPLSSEVVAVDEPVVAVYVGQTPSLPGTVTATLTDASTREVPVTWDVSGVDTSTPWVTHHVTGTYGSATVRGTIEVVPQGTVAFADIGGTESGQLGRTSPTWSAVSELVGDALVNEAPDQVHEPGTSWGSWGQDATGKRSMSYKGLVDGAYDKLTTTGMFTANQKGAELSYTVTLPAGTYTLWAGSHSWWPSNSRSMDVVLRYDGADHKVDFYTLDTSSASRLLEHQVTLAQEGEVTLILRATNDQSPMLSWFAASKAGSTEPMPEPTDEPTVEPTLEPTDEPTAEPSDEPSPGPSNGPSDEPTTEPSIEPTDAPGTDPGDEPGDPATSPAPEPSAPDANGDDTDAKGSDKEQSTPASGERSSRTPSTGRSLARTGATLALVLVAAGLVSAGALTRRRR
ncbi:Ig-like domain-containing protein, partial [Actinomyces sp. MRS3W]|uniref:Ig-like domain-containing protein n=1 Tax=Actinomyces sp. MRS3W TaxID=2800796 RepID=UPI0028FD6B02